MAGSNYNLEITGDNAKFKRVVSDSMKQLDDLSKKTGGAFASISGQMGNMSGLLSTIKGLPGPLMAVGAAAAGASLAFDAFNNSREMVANLNQLVTTSGLTAEQLQKMGAAFKSTGIDMEGFADINQDVLDKLGDGVRDGSGVIEDLKKYGVELNQLEPMLNKADGGLKAVINTFYQMKNAGKSQAEIVNAMEAMGSNAAKLIPTLTKLGSEQNALNHINKQQANISNETAEAYKNFETAITELKTDVTGFLTEAMTPMIEVMTDSINYIGKIKKIINSISTDSSAENIKSLKEEFGLLASMIETVMAVMSKFEKLGELWTDYVVNPMIDQAAYAVSFFDGGEAQKWQANRKKEQQFDRNEKERKKNLAGAISQAEDSLAVTDTGGQTFSNEAAEEEAKKTAEKIAKAAADAAKKAAEAAKKELAERKQLLSELNTINQSLYTQQASTFASETQQAEASVAKLSELLQKGLISQEEFEAKRKAIVDQSGFNLEQTLLGVQDGDLATILAGINQVYADQNANLKSQLEARLITQEEFNQKMELNESLHTARMYEFQVAKDNSLQALRELGFTTEEENFQMEMEKLDEQFEKLQADNQARYDAQIISYEEFLASKSRLEEVYAAKSTQLENDKMKANLSVAQSLSDSMTGIFSGAFGKQSKAAQAAFVVSKSLAIAQSTMDAHSAATKALATYPQPMGGIMAGAAYAQVLAQVASIKSTNLTGMAHDGIDNVPEEGTWLLNKGERVVDNRTNQDLKDFLKDGGSSNNSPIEINAPLNITGNVDSSDRMVMDAINRYPEEVARMVEKAQSKRM